MRVREGAVPRHGGVVGHHDRRMRSPDPCPSTRRSVLAGVLLLAAGLALATAPTVGAQSRNGIDDRNITAVRAITFPVEGATFYRPDFLAPRSGGRRHAGADIFADKLTPLVAARDGVIDRMSGADVGLSGNYLVLRDAEGWEYLYVHVNNDTPGTDDGANPPEWRFAPGIVTGATVRAGAVLGFLGDSGNAETTPPHLHFEMRRPDGTRINPWPSLRTAEGLPVSRQCVWGPGPANLPERDLSRTMLAGDDEREADDDEPGVWLVTDVGEVVAAGTAPHLGDARDLPLKAEVVGVSGTSSGDGYWLVAGDGGVFSYGDAVFHGSTGNLVLNEPVVGLAATAGGRGYWLVASDGGVFSYGDAVFHGSMGGRPLNQPVVGIDPTATAGGYRMIATDGGVFSFGDAAFVGSLPGEGIRDHIVDLAAGERTDGYWLLNARGGVYPFGEVEWHGSVQSAGLCEPHDGAALAATPSGRGYWVLTTSGAVFAFGDAVDPGVLDEALTGRAVALVARATGPDRTILGGDER